MALRSLQPACRQTVTPALVRPSALQGYADIISGEVGLQEAEAAEMPCGDLNEFQRCQEEHAPSTDSQST